MRPILIFPIGSRGFHAALLTDCDARVLGGGGPAAELPSMSDRFVLAEN